MVSTGVVTLILGTLAVGGGAAITFVTKVLPGLNRATGWIYNQSLGGAISRVAHQSVLVVQTTSWPVQVANLVAALLVLGLAAWAIRPEWRCREERGAEFGLAITAMLLAGASPGTRTSCTSSSRSSAFSAWLRRAGGAPSARPPSRRWGADRLRAGCPARDLRSQHERDRRDQPDTGLVALPPALLAALRERGVAGCRPGPEPAAESGASRFTGS